MLAKSQRLNLSQVFKFVTAGSRRETATLKLFWRQTEGDVALVGIALAKKNLRKATQRNKAKRLISQAIEQLYERLQPGLNLVIMPKSEILQRSVEELKAELENEARLYRAN